jgi:hypothetical protein
MTKLRKEEVQFNSEPRYNSITPMNRPLSLLLSTAFLLTLLSVSRAAPPVDPTLAYPVSDSPADANFWCAFPDVANQWSIALYETRRHGKTGVTYRKIAEEIKQTGPSWRFLCQLLTVPSHTSDELYLVAYRNGIQQPYIGFTEDKPYGWHTFGQGPPAQAMVVEIPAGTSAKEINRYESAIRQEWTDWPRR